MSNNIYNSHMKLNTNKKLLTISRTDIIIFIFLFGLLLTTAKGLRVGGDLGPGELLCLIFALYSLLYNNHIKLDRIFNVTNIFWFTVFSSLFIGLFIRLNFTHFEFQFPRTLLAYIFCYMIIFSIFKSKLLTVELTKTIKIYLIGIVIISGVFSTLIMLGIKSIFGINLYWEGTTRFQGWSLDPNQLSLLYPIAPFLLFYLFQRSDKRLKTKILYILSAILICIPVMVADSDSIKVSWVIAGIVLLMIYLSKKLNLYKLLLIIISISIISIKSQEIFGAINNIMIELFFKDDQGMQRINVWLESIDIIKVSPVFGLGPDMGRITESGRALGEAHNNFLQLGMESGIVGMLALLFYLLFIFAGVLRSNNLLLLGAFISLFAFGLTHYTLRHPLYWFMLLLIYALSKSEIRVKKIRSNIGD